MPPENREIHTIIFLYNLKGGNKELLSQKKKSSKIATWGGRGAYNINTRKDWDKADWQVQGQSESQRPRPNSTPNKQIELFNLKNYRFPH